MNQPMRRLTSFLAVLLIAACSRDVTTGLPEMAADHVASAKKLKDAIAFFTRDFNPTDGGLALMGTDGSARRPLAGGELGFEPDISPDGRRIAFSRNTDVGVTSVFVMNVDGTATTEVAGGLVFNPTPRWSPDGCQIAFTYSQSDQQTGPRVSIVNADGSGFRLVTPAPDPNEFVFEEGPTWSPDGTRLAFSRNSILHVIDVDGTGMAAVSSDFGFTPSWSPDGQRIAFGSLDGIKLINVDGTNLVQVTTPAPGEFDSWPRWSPDGQRLVISHFDGTFVQIVRINADGSGAVNLTPSGVHDFMPDWGGRAADGDDQGDDGLARCR